MRLVMQAKDEPILACMETSVMPDIPSLRGNRQLEDSRSSEIWCQKTKENYLTDEIQLVTGKEDNS